MLWEQGVPGSNPGTPTQKTKELQKCDSFFCLHKIMVEMVVEVGLLQLRLQPKKVGSIRFFASIFLVIGLSYQFIR